MKAQNVRLLDVFILGPFMLYLSLKASPANNFERKALSILGVATILYNWRNYRAQAAIDTADAGDVALPAQVVAALDFVAQEQA